MKREPVVTAAAVIAALITLLSQFVTLTPEATNALTVLGLAVAAWWVRKRVSPVAVLLLTLLLPSPALAQGPGPDPNDSLTALHEFPRGLDAQAPETATSILDAALALAAECAASDACREALQQQDRSWTATFGLGVHPCRVAMISAGAWDLYATGHLQGQQYEREFVRAQGAEFWGGETFVESNTRLAPYVHDPRRFVSTYLIAPLAFVGISEVLELVGQAKIGQAMECGAASAMAWAGYKNSQLIGAGE